MTGAMASITVKRTNAPPTRVFHCLLRNVFAKSDQPCQEGKDPSVVARKYRGDKDNARGDEQLRCALQLGGLQSLSVFNDEQDCPDHLRQEQRFVHRCRLHIEQTGIQGEEQRGNQGAPRLNPVTRETIDAGGSKYVCPHRGKRASHPRLPPFQARDKRNQQQVGQREPNRTELRQSRIEGVDDSPRDVEMRNCVSIEQHDAA